MNGRYTSQDIRTCVDLFCGKNMVCCLFSEGESQEEVSRSYLVIYLFFLIENLFDLYFVYI